MRARITVAASSWAGTSRSAPPKPPTGVRTGSQITASRTRSPSPATLIPTHRELHVDQIPDVGAEWALSELELHHSSAGVAWQLVENLHESWAGVVGQFGGEVPRDVARFEGDAGKENDACLQGVVDLARHRDRVHSGLRDGVMRGDHGLDLE